MPLNDAFPDAVCIKKVQFNAYFSEFCRHQQFNILIQIKLKTLDLNKFTEVQNIVKSLKGRDESVGDR